VDNRCTVATDEEKPGADAKPRRRGGPPDASQLVSPPWLQVVEPVNSAIGGTTTFAAHEPMYKKWWLWTVVAGVVIAEALRSVGTWRDPKLPSHDFGPIHSEKTRRSRTILTVLTAGLAAAANSYIVLSR